MFSSAEPAEGRSWSSDSVGNGNSEAISANANETNWKTGAAILAQPFPEEDEDTLVLPKAAADMEGDAPEEPCDEVASCFSFRGSDQMCSEYSPSRAYQEERRSPSAASFRPGRLLTPRSSRTQWPTR
ncbi:unnamed protein product [Effrenium voratum]|nr:unnamed protein product [Effrenium voratum]